MAYIGQGRLIEAYRLMNEWERRSNEANPFLKKNTYSSQDTGAEDDAAEDFMRRQWEEAKARQRQAEAEARQARENAKARTHTAPMSLDEAYAFFGLSRTCSAEELAAAHRAWLKKNHPDRFADAAEEIRRAANETVARVNDARDQIARDRGF